MPIRYSAPAARARACILPLVVLAAGCATSSEPSLPQKKESEQLVIEESNPLELDASALNAAATALGAFKAKNRNLQCFQVSMHSQEDNWRVDFIPSDDVQ
jgi:hypothetical protein